MRFRYEPDKPGRPFEQIRDQVTSGVAKGSLVAGDRLPAIRQLAADLRLAPGTVAKAIGELERDGYVETRGRGGTYIAASPGDLAAERAELSGLAGDFARRSRQLGVSSEAALREVERALAEAHDQR